MTDGQVNIILYSVIIWYGLGLWCLTQLSTIFQLYRGGDYLNLIYPNVHEEKNTTDT
jgi:hypothetical protein